MPAIPKKKQIQKQKQKPNFIFGFQINFDAHLKAISEMTEVGETAERVETLIEETKRFQKICDVDIEKAEDVVSIGMSQSQFKIVERQTVKLRSFNFV